MQYRSWLFALLAVILLSSGAAAPLQNDNSSQAKPPPCERCSVLLERSSAILESCRGLDGAPQMTCLEAYDRAAELYEACAMRQLDENAPICTPPPNVGDATKPNDKAPACSAQSGQGGAQSCSYVTNKPPPEPVPDASENPPAQPPPPPPPSPDKPPSEGKTGGGSVPSDDKKGGAEGSNGGEAPQPAPPIGDGPIKTPPDTPGPAKDGGAADKPPASGGDGPGGSTGPVTEGAPVPTGGSGSGQGAGVCPEATQGLAASKTVITPDLFLDRVGMPLYLPKAFKQSALPSEITPEKLAWIVAHSMIEKGTSRPTVFGERNNIFSIQLDASVLGVLNKSSGGRFGQLIGGGLKKTEICEYKGEKQTAIPKNSICQGQPLFNAGNGKWLVSNSAMAGTYNDYVAALEGYLIFLKHYRPGAYAALVNPSSTLGDYANGLKGYGNGPGYGKGQAETDHLVSRLSTQMKAQAKYLDARLGLMASGSCGGMAAQRARLEAIRAEARKY